MSTLAINCRGGTVEVIKVSRLVILLLLLGIETSLTNVQWCRGSLHICHASLHFYNSVITQKWTGCLWKTNSWSKRHSCWIAEADNQLKPNLAALLTPSKSRYQLYHHTTWKILAKAGLFHYKELSHTLFGVKNIKIRVQKDDNQWSVWTDKSTFQVGKNYRTTWVTWWVEVYLSKNCKPLFKSKRISIEVQRAFCEVKSNY